MIDEKKGVIREHKYQPFILSLLGVCTAGLAFYVVYTSLKQNTEPPVVVDAADLKDKKIYRSVNNTDPVLLLRNTTPITCLNRGARTIVLSKGKYHGQTKTIVFTSKLSKVIQENNITICSRFLHLPGQINSPDSYYHIDMKYEGQSINLIWLTTKTNLVDENDCAVTLSKWYLQSASNCEISGGHEHIVTIT